MCFHWRRKKKKDKHHKISYFEALWNSCEGLDDTSLLSVSLCCIWLQVSAGPDFPPITINHVWGSTGAFLKLYQHPRSEGTRTWMQSSSIVVCGTSSLLPAEGATCQTRFHMINIYSLTYCIIWNANQSGKLAQFYGVFLEIHSQIYNHEAGRYGDLDVLKMLRSRAIWFGLIRGGGAVNVLLEKCWVRKTVQQET